MAYFRLGDYLDTILASAGRSFYPVFEKRVITRLLTDALAPRTTRPANLKAMLQGRVTPGGLVSKTQAHSAAPR